MMHEHGKSDSAIVATKPTNKAGQPAAEPVERRAGTEGNAGHHSTRQAQHRESVSEALGRIRQVAKQRKKERFTSLLHHVGIDLLLFKRGFQIIVGISLYAIALAQFAVLFTTSSDDCCQLGVFSMFKCRQHGRLRDVSQPDNGIANFLIPHVPSPLVL